MANGIEQPINLPEHAGALLHEWAFPEFTQYQRSRRWYTIAGIVIGLLLIYALWTQNFLFAIIIILFIIIFTLQSRRSPLQLRFAIHEGGVVFHRKFHPYADIDHFWIIYQPPDVKTLSLDFKTLRPTLTIPLQDRNPLTIRSTLLKYVTEDLEKEKENPSNELMRLLKL